MGRMRSWAETTSEANAGGRRKRGREDPQMKRRRKQSGAGQRTLGDNAESGYRKDGAGKIRAKEIDGRQEKDDDGRDDEKDLCCGTGRKRSGESGPEDGFYIDSEHHIHHPTNWMGPGNKETVATCRSVQYPSIHPSTSEGGVLSSGLTCQGMVLFRNARRRRRGHQGGHDVTGIRHVSACSSRTPTTYMLV
ncbi:hypothetical protein LY76DRAFT_332532 [Colletotrichum caudatum]|nr:hypothetical protein LY76DRAFT_332532 [Colletotrichum caudatum]